MAVVAGDAASVVAAAAEVEAEVVRGIVGVAVE